MRGRFLWLLFLACFGLFQFGMAQPDRPMVQINSARQNDFTFFNSLDARYVFEKGKYSLDLQFHHDNIYNTSLPEQRFVQLYFKSTLWQRFAWKTHWTFVSLLENDHYLNSDNEKVTLYGGVRYSPDDWLEVTPLIGIAADRRNDIVNVGPSPGILVSSTHDFGNDLSMEAGLWARVKLINPRIQRNVTVFQLWNKEFQENTSILVGVKGGSHELDDYLGNTDSLGLFRPQTVKRILSDSLNPLLNLAYDFGKGVIWQSENDILLHRRQFLYKTLDENPAGDNDLSFQGMDMTTRQRLTWRSKKLQFSGYYEFFFANRNYNLENTTMMNDVEFEQAETREMQKDFSKRQHKTDLRLLWRWSQRHALDLNLTQIYLQFDTPSETNYDDRDELSYITSGGILSNWSPGFQTSFALSGNYRHYAFLNAEKSQDNYIQRSLRMDFGANWEVSPLLRLEGNNAVYVTYNVKDFTDYNKTDRSTRNLEANWKAFLRPTKRLENRFTLYRKETHQSYLNWAEFSETTLDTIRILTTEQTNRFTLPLKEAGAKMLADIGYKHFNQTKKFQTTMTQPGFPLQPISLHQINVQSGPTVGVGYKDKRQSSIEAMLWLQFQYRHNKWLDQENLGSIGSSYTIEELRMVEREVKPYFTLNFNYYFQ